jgi:hypothetical protein
MVRKAAWMFVLLVALLAVSVTVAWAAGLDRSAQTSLASGGSAAVSTLAGRGDGSYVAPYAAPERHGRCFQNQSAASAEPAY